MTITDPVVTTGPEVDNLAAIASTLDASTAASTRKAYGIAQRGFEAYCAEHSWSVYPTTDDEGEQYVLHVLAYLQSKSDAGCSLSTLIKSLAGLRHHAARDSRHAARALRTYADAVSAFMAGAARQRKATTPKQAAAFTTGELRQLYRYLDRAGTVRALRDHALIALGVGAALRSQSLADLTLGDVGKAVSVDGLNVALKFSKTDQTGAGRMVTVRRSVHRDLDPVAAVEAWMSFLRGRGWTDDQPLFPRLRGSVPQDARIADASSVVTDLIRQHVIDAGIATAEDSLRYTSHSLRSSFATLSAQAGVPSEVVARTTGHASIDTLRRYDRTSHERAAQSDYLNV